MKVFSGLFERALEMNVYQFNGQKVNIMSFSKNGYGIVRKEDNPNGWESDNIRFCLKKVDADMLAKFGSELVLEMKNNTITVHCGTSKVSLQNITNIEPPNVVMKDMVSTGAKMSEFVKASGISSKLGVQLAAGGIACASEDLSFVYRNITPLAMPDLNITIPKEAVKLLDKSKEYEIKANNSIAAFVAPGEMVYTNLMIKFDSRIITFDPKPEGWFKVKDQNEFMKHIAFIEGFSKVIKITFEKKDTFSQIVLSNNVDTQDPREYRAVVVVETNIESGSRMCSVENLKKLINAVNTDEFMFMIDNKMIKLESESEMCYIAQVTNHELIPLKYEGEETNG